MRTGPTSTQFVNPTLSHQQLTQYANHLQQSQYKLNNELGQSRAGSQATIGQQQYNNYQSKPAGQVSQSAVSASFGNSAHMQSQRGAVSLPLSSPSSASSCSSASLPSSVAAATQKSAANRFPALSTNQVAAPTLVNNSSNKQITNSVQPTTSNQPQNSKSFIVNGLYGSLAYHTPSLPGCAPACAPHGVAQSAFGVAGQSSIVLSHGVVEKRGGDSVACVLEGA